MARLALVIANNTYTDPGLAQLTAPGNDAEDFARVLKSQDICAFDEVRVLLNEQAFVVSEAIDELYAQKKPDDLLVLYFSGHGVRDEIGTLYLAVKNTNRYRLHSTAIKSDFIRESMDQSRSKRQILILDCCNSGAFAPGTKAAGGSSMGIATAFEGTGYGHIVLTASDSTQFAWEGDKVIGETKTSLFTHFLVKGLEGDADQNGDGRITVDELYDFVYDQIHRITPNQTPSKWSYKEQGEIVLRQNMRIEDIKPIALPEELTSALENPLPYVREAAVRQLEVLTKGKNLGQARSARLALEKLVNEDDSRRVVQAANQVLESIRQAEQLASQKAEEEKIAREKAEAEKKAEAERLAREEAEREASERAIREEVQRLIAERKAKEIAERERAEREKAENEARELAQRELERKAALELAEREKAENEARELAQRELERKAALELAEREKAENKARELAESARPEGLPAPIDQPMAGSQAAARTFKSALDEYTQRSVQVLKNLSRAQKNTAVGGLILLALVLTAVGFFRYQQQIINSTPVNHFYFSSNRNNTLEAYDITLDGAVRQLTNTTGGNGSWSPAPSQDGNLYFASNRSGKIEIWRLGEHGTEKVTDTPGDYQSWSPVPDAAGSVYFASNRSGKTEIWKLGENFTVKITNTPGNSESWTPAISQEGYLYFASNRSGKIEIWRLGIDGTVQVTNTPGNFESWSPAPATGGYLYFASNRSGKTEIWRTGSELTRQITNSPGTSNSWGPRLTSTNYLYFSSDRNGRSEVYCLDAQGKSVNLSNSPLGYTSWTALGNDRLPKP